MPVKLCLPQWGQGMEWALIYSNISSLVMPSAWASGSKSSMRLSARKRSLHSLQSSRGSEKLATWPLASQTRGCMRMSASTSKLLCRSWMNFLRQASFTLFFSRVPRGP